MTQLPGPHATTAEDIVKKLAQSATTTEGPDDCVFCDAIVGRPNIPHRDDCLFLAAKEWVFRQGLGSGIDWPKLPTLLDLCREFDAIDLTECNRRLEAGEKFDADCDAAMEKRNTLAEQIKGRLGERWEEFDELHDKFTVESPLCKRPTGGVLVEMIYQEAFDLLKYFNDDVFQGDAKTAERKLRALLT